jgi:hypothetical protein
MAYAWGYLMEAIAADEAVAIVSAQLARGNLEPTRRMVDGSRPFLEDGLRRKWAAAAGDRQRFWQSLDVGERALLVNAELLRQAQLGQGDRWVEQLRQSLAAQQVRWCLRADLWMEPEKGLIIGPLVNHTFLLDGLGRPVMEPLFNLYMTDGAVRHADGLKPQLDGFSTAIFPACLTLSFFHCTNVSVREEAPPARLSKAHERRHGRPLLRYKTLDIHPMQRVLRQEGGSARVGLPRALHICRGHFKQFRQKGLFGKHFGLYWWEMHLRGQRSAGLVSKDYAVHAR